MKRHSVLIAALAMGFVAGTFSSAKAIDPKTRLQTRPNSPSPQPSPAQPVSPAPGLDDPFLNAIRQQSGLLGPGQNATVPLTPPAVNFPRNRDGNSTAPGSPADTRLAPSYLPPDPEYAPPARPRRWRLGVYSKDTEVGVKIMQVVPGSAAAKAGLEAEDTLIAVAGYQVGYVDGRLFDCSTEFERSADEQGWVTMLVQNHRNGQLINLPVQLAPRFSTLTGSLTLDAGRPLPVDAQFAVELQEIVRPGAEPITVASGRIEGSSGMVPIPFSIEYDPQAIDITRNYVVSGTVYRNNRPIYRTAQKVPVFRPGQQTTNISIALSPVTPSFDPRAVQSDRATQIARVEQLYQQYLGRRPKDSELIAILNRLESNEITLADVETNLLGGDQYFNQYDRDKYAYVAAVLEKMVGRPPRPEELEYFVKLYDAKGGLRREFVVEVQDATAGIPR